MRLASVSVEGCERRESLERKGSMVCALSGVSDVCPVCLVSRCQSVPFKNVSVFTYLSRTPSQTSHVPPSFIEFKTKSDYCLG